jgi:hypothetical protein
MARPDDDARDAASRIEQALLAALCQPSLKPEDRTAILQRLENHHFVDPDHEVVYRAIVAPSTAQQKNLRGALIQMVTRMGFPDIEIDGYFSAEMPSGNELQELLSQL